MGYLASTPWSFAWFLCSQQTIGRARPVHVPCNPPPPPLAQTRVGVGMGMGVGVVMGVS